MNANFASIFINFVFNLCGFDDFIQHFTHNICNDDLLIGANVRFRFLYFADYLLPGSTFLFREGRAKGTYFSSIRNCLYLIII